MPILIPQYNQPANIQQLAAQETIKDQQKQAAIFNGGNGIAPPIMGDPATQKLANSITSEIVKGYSLGINDYRGVKSHGNVGVGGMRRYKTRRNKRMHRTHRTHRTHRKKHNKRITKRKYHR